jgi:hypothetical protein
MAFICFRFNLVHSSLPRLASPGNGGANQRDAYPALVIMLLTHEMGSILLILLEYIPLRFFSHPALDTTNTGQSLTSHFRYSTTSSCTQVHTMW